MGGVICAIPWRAIVRYEEVPGHQQGRMSLEGQLRQAYAVPSIYEAVAADGNGPEACTLLGKQHLTAEDLERLLAIGESIYERG